MRAVLWASAIVACMGGCHATPTVPLDPMMKVCGHSLGTRGVGYRSHAAMKHARDHRTLAALAAACDAKDGRACDELGIRSINGSGPGDKAESDRALAYFERACELGEKMGCANLGGAYMIGRGPDDRIARMFALFRRACEKDDECTNLVVAYTYDCAAQATAEDLRAAEAACERRDTDGCTSLGLLYGKGGAVQRDDAKAKKLLDLACERGERLACTNLGMLYRDADGSFGLSRDDARAAVQFQKGCDAGSALACNALGALIGQNRVPGRGVQEAYALAVRACRSGEVPGACTRAGTMLETGTGVRADVDAAIVHFRRACDLGSGEACERLAIHSYTGAHMKKDAALAAKLSERACDADFVDGCYNLGVLLAKGEGIAPDTVRARKLFEGACAADHSLACGALADVLQRGVGGPVDASRGIELGKRACENGAWTSCDGAAVGLARDGDTKIAERLLRLGCEHEEDAACFHLSILLLENKPDAREPEWAAAQLARLCDHGPIEACDHLARYVRAGVGAQKDDARAAALEEKACAAGDQDGCTALAEMLVFGIGTKKDPARALFLSDTACRKNVLAACKQLAILYFEGLGTAVDLARAALLLARTCEGGDQESCAGKGAVDAYEQKFGATPGWVEACDHGEAAACDRLSELRCANAGAQRRSGAFCIERATQRCDGGEAAGCDALGFLLVEGQAAPADPQRALQLFEKACDKGYTRACFNAAVLLAGGRGVIINLSRAKQFFTRACDGKNGEGCRAVGMLQRQDSDDVLARAAFEKACALKDQRGCALLGVMLTNGEGGGKDVRRGKALLVLACKDGDESACSVAR